MIFPCTFKQHNEDLEIEKLMGSGLHLHLHLTMGGPTRSGSSCMYLGPKPNLHGVAYGVYTLQCIASAASIPRKADINLHFKSDTSFVLNSMTCPRCDPYWNMFSAVKPISTTSGISIPTTQTPTDRSELGLTRLVQSVRERALGNFKDTCLSSFKRLQIVEKERNNRRDCQLQATAQVSSVSSV